MRIYIYRLSTLTFYAVLVFNAFTAFLCLIYKRKAFTKTIVFLLCLIAIYGILSYTVLGRTPSDSHTLIFSAPYSNEFFREMFMNALLYYPLGLTLTVLIGPWSILVAFLLSVIIETWQYFAGTGTAQGTDVICNTLGCAIGALPYFIYRAVFDKQKST